MKVYAAFMLPKTLVRMDCTGTPFPFKEAPPHGPCAFGAQPGSPPHGQAVSQVATEPPNNRRGLIKQAAKQR